MRQAILPIKQEQKPIRLPSGANFPEWLSGFVDALTPVGTCWSTILSEGGLWGEGKREAPTRTAW